MNLYTLAEPMRWPAGYCAGRPFYFDCAGCGAHEAVIAGLIGNGPQFTQIGVVGSGPPFRLALYCARCFERLCSPLETEL